MINTEVRRFMDLVRDKCPDLEVRYFRDLRGPFVAIAGIEDADTFRREREIATPDPKDLRVIFFPSKDYYGYTLMLDNPYFTITE